MRKILAATALLGIVAGTAGAASAASGPYQVIAGKCPDGYYGVVVDEHDVCTNVIRFDAAGQQLIAGKCPDGYYGVVVDEHDVCTNLLPWIKVPAN